MLRSSLYGNRHRPEREGGLSATPIGQMPLWMLHHVERRMAIAAFARNEWGADWEFVPRRIRSITGSDQAGSRVASRVHGPSVALFLEGCGRLSAVLRSRCEPTYHASRSFHLVHDRKVATIAATHDSTDARNVYSAKFTFVIALTAHDVPRRSPAGNLCRDQQVDLSQESHRRHHRL
jgi:hypothetical protein